jgi:hypothetical protein
MKKDPISNDWVRCFFDYSKADLFHHRVDLYDYSKADLFHHRVNLLDYSKSFTGVDSIRCPCWSVFFLCLSSSCVPLLPVSLDCTFGLPLQYSLTFTYFIRAQKASLCCLGFFYIFYPTIITFDVQSLVCIIKGYKLFLLDLFDLLKSLYSDINILSKCIPSLQKKL